MSEREQALLRPQKKVRAEALCPSVGWQSFRAVSFLCPQTYSARVGRGQLENGVHSPSKHEDWALSPAPQSKIKLNRRKKETATWIKIALFSYIMDTFKSTKL